MVTRELEMPENVDVAPFKDATDFLDHDLTLAYVEDTSAILLKQLIRFKGILGYISAFADPRRNFNNPITPFGKARLIKTFNSGRMTVEESPILLEVGFYPKTREEYQSLGDYSCEFKFKSESYYLACDGDLNDDDRAIAENSFYHYGEPLLLKDSFMINEKDEEKEVTLPQDLAILRHVIVNIQEYEDDDDDESQVDIPSPLMPIVVR